MGSSINSWNRAASKKRTRSGNTAIEMMVTQVVNSVPTLEKKAKPKSSFFDWIAAKVIRLGIFLTFLVVTFWAASGVSLDLNQDFWSNVVHFRFPSPKILFEQIQAFIQTHWMG